MQSSCSYYKTSLTLTLLKYSGMVQCINLYELRKQSLTELKCTRFHEKHDTVYRYRVQISGRHIVCWYPGTLWRYVVNRRYVEKTLDMIFSSFNLAVNDFVYTLYIVALSNKILSTERVLLPFAGDLTYNIRYN